MLRRGARVGRYTIERLLGQGGMGQVHAAVDQELRRKVALKTVHARGELAPDPEAVARLMREARAAARLNHPNAVAIHDVGEHGGMAFIAMELVEGTSLREGMKDASVPIATKVGWMIDVARVLAEAHRHGIIHRDVKPDNVMIRHDGVVKVLDFGLAKRLAAPGEPTAERTAEITAAGMVLGTHKYMAPEAFEGIADPRTDQFAWAVVTYELLTGERPFVPPPTCSAYEWLLRHDPAPLAQRAPVPRQVSDVVMKAMAKSASDRFSSMQDIVAALSAWRADESRGGAPEVREP